MKNARYFFALLIANISYSQITVINTGTSENLVSITSIGKNFLVSGYQTFLGKCYGECNAIFSLVVPPFPNSTWVFEVDRPDTNVLFMTACSSSNLNLTFWKSADGGYNWFKKFDTVNPSMYQGVTIFFDTLTGISFSDNYKSIKTFDGFKTYSFGTWNSWFLGGHIQLCGDSTILLSDLGGYLISKDRGNTWPFGQGLGTNNAISFACLNEDTLFCIASGNFPPSYLFSSFDGGKSWSFKGINGNSPGATAAEVVPVKLYVKNKNEIFITARSSPTGFGTILKTADLGQSWSGFVTPFKEYLSDMTFINDSIALVCGNNGLLFKWNTKTAVFTGISENKSSEINALVYPNPVESKLFIKFNDNEGLVKATLMNVSGQNLLEVSFTGNNGELDFAGMQRGIYFVRLESEKGLRTFKVAIGN